VRWNIGKTVESLSFKGKGMPENGLSVRCHPAKLLSWSNVFPRIGGGGVEMKHLVTETSHLWVASPCRMLDWMSVHFKQKLKD